MEIHIRVLQPEQSKLCITNLNYTVTAGSEVLTAVAMNISIFWDIMQCSPVKVN
jgi:hypothetical protein